MGAFGEKMRSKAKLNKLKSCEDRKNQEKLDFKRVRVLSLVLLTRFIYPCTLLKLIKKLILIVCMIVFYSHLFLIGGSHDIVWGN